MDRRIPGLSVRTGDRTQEVRGQRSGPRTGHGTSEVRTGDRTWDVRGCFSGTTRMPPEVSSQTHKHSSPCRGAVTSRGGVTSWGGVTSLGERCDLTWGRDPIEGRM